MSLRVWLPLNGSLDNLGLENITVTNDGATVNDNGKIGKCYSFNGTSNKIYKDNINAINNTTLSACCWVKIIGWSSTYAYIFSLASGGTGVAQQIGAWLHNSTHQLAICGGGTEPQSTPALSLDTWYHICIVINNNKKYYYLNGTLINTYNINSPQTGNCLCLGARSNSSSGAGTQAKLFFNGLINDFRLYDHALSPKEVEELSKGLILHYKLDSPYIEASTFLDSTITETAYNASIGKYGYNETSNLIKTTGFFKGKNCIKIGTRTAGQTAQPYAYFSNLYTSDGTNSPAYKALSFDYYTTVSTTTWLNIYKLGNGSGTASWKTKNSDGIFNGTYTNSSQTIKVKPNEWNHIEVIFHGTTADDANWGYCVNGAAHTSSADNYFLFANIQLEQNDHVTGYRSDFHSNIIYDESGYGNNATANNIIVSNDSPKYNLSSTFNGSNSYIKVTDNNWNPQGMEQMTINIWAKATTWPTNGGRLLSCTETGGFNLEAGNSGYWRFPIHVYTNEGKTSTAYKYDSKEILISSLIPDEWNMITLVYDAATGTKTYINGELHHTYSNVSYGIHFNTSARLFLGCEANTASAYTPYFNGKESDFRIYGTVLTDAQIKELYDTSVGIDSNGDIYAREVIE